MAVPMHGRHDTVEGTQDASQQPRFKAQPSQSLLSGFWGAMNHLGLVFPSVEGRLVLKSIT